MAGEWLKFEKATLDKPEVFAIAARLGIDPDAVVGKLMRVWSWFDTHTVDGNAAGVTTALLDRIAGATGFVSAMHESGWVVVAEDGVSLPNFDRHTGETAKKRALTAKRVAHHRSKGNVGSNDGSVTQALAREEKRREENKDTPIVPKGDSSADAVLDAYHEILPACQRISVLNDKRRKRIAAAVKLAKRVCADQGWDYEPVEFWRAYFTECAADAWMRGEVPNPNNPAWKQNLDVLLAEDRFAGVMDKAIAAMRGGA